MGKYKEPGFGVPSHLSKAKWGRWAEKYRGEYTGMRLYAPLYAQIILGMSSANEMMRYNVTHFLIDWSHTQNDPCLYAYDTERRHFWIIIV